MNKILVIGDVILDQYILGSINRISPEAPVPVVKYDNIVSVLGGAANVAANLEALSANYEGLFVISSKVSKEYHGLYNKLQNVTYLLSDTIGITQKTRVMVSENQQLARLDIDNAVPLSNIDTTTYLQAIKTRLESNKFTFLVIADYCKNLLTDSMITEIMQSARQNNVKVLVDTKRKNIRPYAGAYLITPNEKEVLEIKSGSLHDITYCLVTKGKKGMVLTSNQPETLYACDALPVQNPDVSGAGDTVLATIAFHLSSLDGDIVQAVKTASIAASIVVSKPGTSVVTIQELSNAIEQGKDKITTVKSLRFILKQFRDNDTKIVFTNGCFDVIHQGHLELLSQCTHSSNNYAVVVAVDSNERVTQLKGRSRPINKNRVDCLAALLRTSLVIEFSSDEELLDIIKICKPDVMVKGEDYKDKLIIGADYVKSYGGEVRFVPLVSDISTTKMVEFNV